MAKKKSQSQLKKDCWKECSLFVRQSNADQNGICTCATCGVRKHWKELQAGHAIGGRHNYILFDLDILFPQCPTCNIWRGGEYEKFAVILIKKHGLDWYEEKLRYKSKQFTAQELIDLKDAFKEKLKHLTSLSTNE